MQSAHEMHRQCSDCHYHSGHKCNHKERIQQDHRTDANDSCQFFARASLHYAFFYKY